MRPFPSEPSLRGVALAVIWLSPQMAVPSSGDAFLWLVGFPRGPFFSLFQKL